VLENYINTAASVHNCGSSAKFNIGGLENVSAPAGLLAKCCVILRNILRIAFCSCREAVKLFRFLPSPYSLVGTCKSLQNCTLCDCTGTFYSLL
jgi:hypothetical protein